MGVVIRRNTLEQFRERRDDLVFRLVTLYQSIEGEAIIESDLRDFALMGCLYEDERALYDELYRVEMLLGD